MDADEVVRRLGLLPHPEGGFYRETYRSGLTLDLPDGRRRAAATAIHYLLPAGAWSAWHRVASDEIWHHYDGGALRLHLLGGSTRRLHRGEPQALVPAGVWQAAEPEEGPVLCGCSVAPGFDFADFELGQVDELVTAYPDQEALIRRLGR
ncbi:MAG TPA: cupin domain-containing protein [Gemmatimonadales bacterium]